MSEGKIIQTLRDQAPHRSAVELAEVLGELLGEELSAPAIIMNFHRAFPQIPLGVLLESGLWARLSPGDGRSDEWFNEHLGPWIRPGKS